MSADFEEDVEIRKLIKQEKIESSKLNKDQASALVSQYYSVQKSRISAGNRLSAYERQMHISADSDFLQRIRDDLKRLEKQMATCLGIFAESSLLGRWTLSHWGIGPVLAAGLLAEIDFYRCCCKNFYGIPQNEIPKHECKGLVGAGSLFRFAGLDPTAVWEKGKKRPYNASLKTLCWKIGESFKKCSENNLGKSLYARLYRERKAKEVILNEKGFFKDQAYARLEKFKNFRISEEQRQTWASGKLQLKGLDLRAMRHAVTIFLSHFHTVGRKILFNDDVVPWALQHGGHIHYIAPPNWPMKE